MYFLPIIYVRISTYSPLNSPSYFILYSTLLAIFCMASFDSSDYHSKRLHLTTLNTIFVQIFAYLIKFMALSLKIVFGFRDDGWVIKKYSADLFLLKPCLCSAFHEASQKCHGCVQNIYTPIVLGEMMIVMLLCHCWFL